MEQQQGATGEQQDPASITKKPLVPPPKDFVPSRALQNSKFEENLFQDGSYAVGIGAEKVQGPGSDNSGTLSGSGTRQSNGQHGTAPSSSSSQNPLYKTELCRSWEEFGNCRYGTKCQFAHSREELRPVQRHPKYKTEVCRTFATTGTCPYGTRCRFIHQSTALAQLRTAKAGASQAVGQEGSVNAGLSGRVVAGPEPIAPAVRVAPSVVNSSVKNNPASFANVARGAVKVGGGMVPKDAAGVTAPQSSYISASMPNGSLLDTGNANSTNSLTGIDIGVAEFRVANASSLSTSGGTYGHEDEGMMKHPAEYETALTAALDVLHFSEDHINSHEASHSQAGGLIGSLSSSDLPPLTHGADLQNNLTASIAASSASHLGSTPVSPTMTGTSLSSSPHFPPVLTQKDSTVGMTANSLGGNSNAASGGRRLPVFSNLVEK